MRPPQAASNSSKPVKPLDRSISADHPLDREIDFTQFDTQSTTHKHDLKVSLRRLKEIIERCHQDTKEQLPQIKAAIFGDLRSAKGCLRTNANVVAVTGVEVEYDKGEI